MTGHIYTVKSLTGKIKSLLEEAFPFLWVTGEISNYSVPASGHAYFTLKDEYAVISSVLFRTQKSKIKFEPENGMKVLGLARLAVYEPRGSYQLIFEHLEPEGTGSLQIAFEQLKKKLAQKGLFDEIHKKKIPFLSNRVCVITSGSGAAVKDIVNVSRRRFPNCCLDILPVKVQGDGADNEICDAVRLANEQIGPDLIILARGGGSLEDLAAFNSENVALAIFNSNIPVITGVGHETDYTIADFVADLRAPTPSAAAELAFPDKAGVKTTVHKYQNLLNTLINSRLSAKKEYLIQTTSRIKNPMRLVHDSRLRLEDKCQRLSKSIKLGIKIKSERLNHLTDMMHARQPADRLVHMRSQVVSLRAGLEHGFKSLEQTSSARLENLRSRLEALNPQSVLDRGYSISRLLPSKKVISDADAVSEGDRIQVILSKGELVTKVEKKHG